MSIELNWQVGEPREVGLHFVAVRLGDAAGVYDFRHWNGNDWESLEFGQVIAFTTLQELKNSLDITWPGDSDFDYKSRSLSNDDSELWSEG